ncbi:retrotransposon protein, putative, ty1-copia subclass [Tanacetum coccineum]
MGMETGTEMGMEVETTMGMEATIQEVEIEGRCTLLVGALKYATCSLLGGALTRWNSYVRTVGHEAAYEMTWNSLIKMMTETYCLRSEIKKMVPEESYKVEKYVGGLPDNIQGNVMSARLKMLQEAIKLANSLTDQKFWGLKGDCANGCLLLLEVGVMEHGFLSQKGSGEGRGVNEKNVNASNLKVVRDGVIPSVVGITVEMEKLSPLEDSTVLGYFPPLSTPVTTTSGNALGKSSYANDTGKPSGKKVKFRTLFTPGGNGIDVVVLVESIRAISERFANTSYGFFLGNRVAYPVVANYVRNTWDGMLENGPWFIRNNPLILKKWHPNVDLLKEDVSTVPVWVKLHGVPVTDFSEDGLSAIATKLDTPLILDSYTSDMCMQSWGRSSYARAMIELRVDMELKDNIVVAMPKITEEGHYTCNIRVEYEWKPHTCASCKAFGHNHEECPKNTGAGETKNLKKTSQAPKGIPVGPKVGFKPTKEYRPVPKKHTANSSGNKKKGVDSTNKVSDSNPFEVLNSFDNDVEMGTNEGTSNLDNNGANSSGSSFWNVENSSTSTTPIMDKIGKFENLVIDGQAILVDEAGNPFKKVEYPGDHDSEDVVASVDNDMARDLALERTGFGTQSLLEQWKDSYGNGDSDEDPYDDDMYEGQDLSEESQTICDKLDI